MPLTDPDEGLAEQRALFRNRFDPAYARGAGWTETPPRRSELWVGATGSGPRPKAGIGLRQCNILFPVELSFA